MRTIDKHIQTVQSGKVTKTNIIGLRKALNAIERLQRGYSPDRINVTIADLSPIIQAIRKHEPIATGDLHDSGIARLTDKRYRNRWNERQAAIISDIVQFQLIDYTEFERKNVPVYRVTGSNGDSFAFINPSWQSGGNGPEWLPYYD